MRSIVGRGLFTRLFRERRGKHLEFAVDRQVLRRGEDVTVTLTVTETGKLEKGVEVGVVCTETYADRQTSSGGSGTRTHRALVDAAEYERWQRAEAGMPIQRFTLSIPHDGPFSYEGEHLSLAWRASAREPVRFRPDPARNLDSGCFREPAPEARARAGCVRPG